MPYPKYSKDEVRSIIDNEGLGYAVMEYMSADNLGDDIAPEIFHAWNDAEAALREIESYFFSDSE